MHGHFYMEQVGREFVHVSPTISPDRVSVHSCSLNCAVVPGGADLLLPRTFSFIEGPTMRIISTRHRAQPGDSLQNEDGFSPAVPDMA